MGAGLAVQNVRFRSFGFKGSELGVEDCGLRVRIDWDCGLRSSGIAAKHLLATFRYHQ